jgi:hypothetical protein
MKSTDCIHAQNRFAGFVGSHNHRCSRGLTSPVVHLGATHHARVGHWCGRVCLSCSKELAKRTGAIVRELTPAELGEVPA